MTGGSGVPAQVAPRPTTGPGSRLVTVTVARRRVEAEGVVSLQLRAPGGGCLPRWEPGAHVDLHLGPGLVRQYSLCGDPDEPDVWQVAVLRAAAGRGGSAAVHDRLVEGTQLQVGGPRNAFPLLPAPRYLFIAGGIGITPILPMLAAARAAGADWRLAYGGRSRSSMAFLDRLPADPERVEVFPQDEAGLLPLRRLLPAPGAGSGTPPPLVYCCGPEPLLAAVERACSGWPDGWLRTERFAPRAQPADTPAAGNPGLDNQGLDNQGFEVELSGSGTTLTVPADRSLLQVLEDSGVAMLSSCREGTCGTCEVGVLAGDVEHRDSLLTPAERAAGDIMLPCVSRARGARLVLDL